MSATKTTSDDRSSRTTTYAASVLILVVCASAAWLYVATNRRIARIEQSAHQVNQNLMDQVTEMRWVLAAGSSIIADMRESEVLGDGAWKSSQAKAGELNTIVLKALQRANIADAPGVEEQKREFRKAYREMLRDASVNPSEIPDRTGLLADNGEH